MDTNSYVIIADMKLMVWTHSMKQWITRKRMNGRVKRLAIVNGKIIALIANKEDDIMSEIKLVLAQSADHTDPKNLKRIVNMILEQNDILRFGGNAVYNDALARCISYAPDFMNVLNFYPDMINADDYSVEEKYDGFSYLNTEGRFFSKRLSTAKGSEGTPVEKTNHVPHISSVLKRVYEQCGCDLHGELYIPGGISDNMTSIMGCTEDEAQRRQAVIQETEGYDALPHYRLFDLRAIYGKSIVNEPHRVRRALLSYVYYQYIFNTVGSRFINLAEKLHGDPREHFRRIVLAGGEGIIIKREDALYIPGKKPANNWIKGKKKVTHDVVLMGLNNNGTGKNINLFGSIEFGHIISDKLTKCGNCTSGISDDMRQYIYNNADQLISKKQVFEIEAIQESVKSFRNPVFLRLRDDKDWTECLPVSIRVKEELI
jgi:ATP-dependent DNA ligase